MRLILTFLIVAAAVIDTVIGIGFLINPVSAGTDFGLIPDGPQGLAVLRADMTAFFFVAAIFMVWGAWQRRGDLLLVPIALFGIAFLGRGLSAMIDGTVEGWWLPMLVEAAHVVALVFARAVLPHHTVRETGEA
ncbi:hypothetical protein [Pseudoblastomonas halimionae]|uniref:DUF4345 domain-containing protein n=1 Tax=Alteriqipengyuania halimionae TaxID=1926630 RepID=A0A6I4TYT0_9SPHN|nr:hypothetical protein [Alteriqipengyuania halimionae]MXP08778.1 hypothetical protein [Alteriqipengyuania halimionae]